MKRAILSAEGPSVQPASSILQVSPTPRAHTSPEEFAEQPASSIIPDPTDSPRGPQQNSVDLRLWPPKKPQETPNTSPVATHALQAALATSSSLRPSNVPEPAANAPALHAWSWQAFHTPLESVTSEPSTLHRHCQVEVVTSTLLTKVDEPMVRVSELLLDLMGYSTVTENQIPASFLDPSNQQSSTQMPTSHESRPASNPTLVSALCPTTDPTSCKIWCQLPDCRLVLRSVAQQHPAQSFSGKLSLPRQCRSSAWSTDALQSWILPPASHRKNTPTQQDLLHRSQPDLHHVARIQAFQLSDADREDHVSKHLTSSSGTFHSVLIEPDGCSVPPSRHALPAHPPVHSSQSRAPFCPVFPLLIFLPMSLLTPHEAGTLQPFSRTRDVPEAQASMSMSSGSFSFHPSGTAESLLQCGCPGCCRSPPSGIHMCSALFLLSTR